jgi:hypothetical protein
MALLRNLQFTIKAPKIQDTLVNIHSNHAGKKWGMKYEMGADLEMQALFDDWSATPIFHAEGSTLPRRQVTFLLQSPSFTTLPYVLKGTDTLSRLEMVGSRCVDILAVPNKVVKSLVVSRTPPAASSQHPPAASSQHPENDDVHKPGPAPKQNVVVSGTPPAASSQHPENDDKPKSKPCPASKQKPRKAAVKTCNKKSKYALYGFQRQPCQYCGLLRA